jgi:hypothetical protein
LSDAERSFSGRLMELLALVNDPSRVWWRRCNGGSGRLAVNSVSFSTLWRR